MGDPEYEDDELLAAMQEVIALQKETIKLLSIIALNTEKPSAPATTRAPANGTICFGNYGRSKNKPVAGASKEDLDYYRKGCIRTLEDDSKSRFHDRERVLLSAIDAELTAKHGAGGSGPAPDFCSPDDSDDVPFIHCGGVR
jgi:hypothetical protein